MITGIDLFLGLFNNLAIFIVLVAVYSILNGYRTRLTPLRSQILFGVCFGLFSIICMYVKIPVAEGVIVDQRNTIVVLSGAFGGPLAVVICGVITGAYRYNLGGAGVLAGITGVGLAAFAGIFLRILRTRTDSIIVAPVGSLIATIIILPGFLLVGDIHHGWELLKAMALPYGSAIYLGILLVGLLLTHEENRFLTKIKLLKSEKQYRELFENLIDTSFRIDNDSNLTVTSPSVEQIFGYQPEEVLYKSIVNLFRTPSDWTDFYTKVVKYGHVDNYEMEIKRKDDSFVWIATNAKLLKNEEGLQIGIEGLARDISQLKKSEEKKLQLEERLRQSQKMEAIGTLAGGIAHDFNNILSGIFGFSQLAKNHVSNPERVTKDINQIIKASQKAANLVQQILAISRKSEHKMQPLNIEYEIKEAIILLRSSIPSTIEMREEFISTAAILGDPTQIHQVIINLGTNAYHAMRKSGGILSVKLEESIISKENSTKGPNTVNGHYLKLEISDTGSGMDSKTLDKVFEPYYTTKEIGEGTGLGLAVVLGIIDKHQGYINVISELEKGSTFQIFFPVIKNPVELNSDKKASEELQKGSETIMVIDDDKTILQSTKELLEECGYNVNTYSDSETAILEFSNYPKKFDLIVTDMTMPKITGIQLSKRILKIRNDIPIILCSGYSENTSENEISKIGITKFVKKPVDIKNLHLTIRDILDGN